MTTDERFWSKVAKQPGPDGCWLWTGCTDHKGYGKLNVGGHTRLAHRLAYAQLVGPTALDLDHRTTCPKRCVNPAHLRPVTNKQNHENLTGAYCTSKSGVRGVSWHKAAGKWRGAVRHHQMQYHVGLYATIEEAERAVIAKRCLLFSHNDLDRAAR